LPSDIKYCINAYDACEGADAVVIITEWSQYRALELPMIKGVMRGNIFIDLRNVYSESRVKHEGFEYTCVGKNNKKHYALVA